LNVIGTKALKFFLLAIQASLLTDFTPYPPFRKIGLKLACNVNIVYGNLKAENSQDYAQTSTKLHVHEFGFSVNAKHADSCSGQWPPKHMLKNYGIEIFDLLSNVCDHLFFHSVNE
jgi:hypothetical protein